MMPTSLARINYELIRKNRWGRLLEPVELYTDIKGHTAELRTIDAQADLHDDGRLYIYAGTEWDFGSGPAVNTPEMVRASLVHDIFCHMTNYRLVPWEVRWQGDRLFRQHIKKYAPKRRWFNPMRYWHVPRWVAVASYSQGIARWKDKR